MTIVQFEYIVAVDTYRSFVVAADKCFVTQPTPQYAGSKAGKYPRC